MWLSRIAFEKLLQDHSVAVGRAAAIEQQNTKLHATMDWMRLRLNQLEHERSVLVENYMGVKIPAPTIERAEAAPIGSAILNEVPSFEDMGDDAASAAGIAWDDTGRLVRR